MRFSNLVLSYMIYILYFGPIGDFLEMIDQQAIVLSYIDNDCTINTEFEFPSLKIVSMQKNL